MGIGGLHTTVRHLRRLHPAATFELAAKACNAAEQLRVVEAVGVCNGAGSADTLSSLDKWKLNRLAGALASGWSGDPALTAARPPAELERSLTAYKTWQRRPAEWDEFDREALGGVHAAWLPAYVAALESFEPGDVPALDDANVKAAGRPTRRQRLETVCAPFCQLLRSELQAAASAAHDASGGALIAPEVVAAFAEHLIDRFELPVAWAVQADQNVAFARSGVARGSATSADHNQYFARTFPDSRAHHAFHLRFPVLARWLATVTAMLCDSGTSLVRRLLRDHAQLGHELFGEDILAFTSVELGKSDYHAGGCSVALVDVLLESGPASFVYKPRCLASERAVQELLGCLADDGVVGFARRRVLAKDGYGYEERIPDDRNDVATPAEAARIYQELGGLLAVFYVLGGSDLHHENIVIADGHAFACDCETALGVEMPRQEAALGTVVDSVYRTGLLDWPLPPTAEIVRRLSGCAGGEAYELPFPVPRLQDGPGLAVRYERGVRVDHGATNRIRLNGQLTEPRDFEDAIVEGFVKVHDWFRHTPTAQERVAGLFRDTQVRLVARSTEVYSHLLLAARHPRCLMEPLEVDLVFARLGEAPHAWDEHGLASAAEAGSLWQLDIPTFGVGATQTALLHDHAKPVAVNLDRSPLECALDRVARLSADDQRQQIGYVRASLSADEVRSSDFVATAQEYACVVGDALCDLLEDPTRPVRWTYREAGPEVDHVEGTLYYGSAGVALFLAYLDAIRPQVRLRRAARSALTHALSRTPKGPGAHDGLAGQIYVLTHLHNLWGDDDLLANAVERSRQLGAMVAADRSFDVLSGSAGVIGVMLGLDRACGVGLDTAHQGARHLLRHAEPATVGLSWPPEHREQAGASLTGFAHGAAGIGWALIALGAAAGREDYVSAGMQAFAYESLHFDPERQDWYDLRTSVAGMARGGRHFANAWCNGAPGIGLSRLASWVALGEREDALLREAYVALSATLRNFHGLGNDTLCHGRSGNAEFLLRFAQARNEPAFQLEANMHAQAHWRRIASNPAWPRVEDGRPPLAGLMVGIAGIGMSFLRLAHPDRVPSPLLLDPPVASTTRKEKRDVR